MKKCWAAVLGNCEGEITREHLYSKGLFRSGRVVVEGFPFLQGKTKSLGINALTSNILCRHHNNALGVVDNVGIAAFRTMRRFEEILSGRQKRLAINDISQVINGRLLERWFIKHAINLFCVSSAGTRWYDDSPPTNPPIDLVEAAFGIKPLIRPLGLYNYAGLKLGDRIMIGDQIGFTPLFLDRRFVGAEFKMQALRFLIWFCKQNGEPKDLPWPAIKAFYHHIGGHFDAPPLRCSLSVEWR